MIPVLFKEDEQVFTHNGIGALYESLSCDVIEEENGAFTMELEYPVDGELFSEIKDFRIVQAKPNDIDEPHNFRIYEIEKSIDELTVYVRANTITNDLGNNLITNYFGNNVTPQQAMNGIKSNLIEPTNFDFISDIQTESNVEWTRINPLNAIVGVRGSMVDIWGGQIKRTNTAIHLYSRRGRDNVVTIRPGKNIEGLNMTVSTAGLVTKILPTFTYRPVDVPKYQMVTNSDGTTEKRRVSTSGSTTLRDDITVLGDVVSSQYVDNYPTNYWSSVDYGDDDILKNKVDIYIDTRLTAAEESPTILDMSGFENDLRNFVKDELDKRAQQYFTHRNPGVDKPTVRIKVDMLQLSDSSDWEEFKDLERIGLTDTLDVWVEEYDIDVEVRVTSLTYDSIAEQVTNFNAGSDRAPRQSAIEKKYDDLTQATNDYITSFKNGVQNVMRNTADGLNRKFEGYTEPPAELSSEGDIWFKEAGEGKVEIWIHDGVYWQPLLTEEFASKIEADMLEQQKDIEDALEAADEAVDRINNEIAGKFTAIDQELLDIEAISNTAQANAQTALDQSLEALGDASTALTNAQTALNQVDGAIVSASEALSKADDALGTATILSGQVSGFETTVAGFNQTVNNYEGQVSGFRNDISGLESTVANYESEVDEFGNTVSTYATEVSTMRNTVSGFESTVATYGTEVSGLAGEVVGYKNQVSTLNNTVDGFNSVVTQVQYDLDNLEIGGRNLVANSKEEVSFTNAIRNHSLDSELMAEYIGETITISFYAEAKIAGQRMDVYLRNASAGVVISGSRLLPFEVSTEYTRYMYTIVLADISEVSNLTLAFRSTATTGGSARGEITVKKLQIEKGNKATDWTPAPEDMATSSQVSTLENTVSGFQSTVSRVEQDYEDVSGTVATHTSQISNLDGEIALKANTTTVNALTGRVSTAETGITANANAIGLKASQTSVDTLTGTVNTLSGRVDVTAGQISSKVWNTDIQTAVDGIEVGGRNYVKNSSFHSGTSFWGRNGNTNTIVDDSSSPSGKAHSATGTGHGVYSRYVDRAQGLEVGEEVTLSVVAKKSGDSGQFTFGAERHSTRAVNLTDSYKRYSHTYINNNGTLIFYGAATIHSIKLEKGNKATDWTPAPEDTTALINHVETELTQKHDSITATVASVRTDLDGTTTLLNTTKSTVDGHTSSISTLRTDVNGKATTAQFNTLNSTVNGTIQRVGTAEGKVTTIETNVSGLQTTVAGKASQTQVTQLENGFNVLSNEAIKNQYSGTWSSRGANLSVSYPNDILRVVQSANYSSVNNTNDRLWGPGFNLTQGTSVNISGEVRMTSGSSGSMTFTQTHSGANRGFQVPTTSSWRYFGGTYTALNNNMFSLFFHNIGTYEIRNLQMTFGGGASEGQLSVLNDNINLRVKKGDVVSQLNIDANRTLISSSKILLNANTVSISGTAWMSGAVITNSSITNAKIADATIASAKIASLDVSKLSGNVAEFTRVSLNSVSSALTLTSRGLRADAGNWSVWMDSDGIDFESNIDNKPIGNLLAFLEGGTNNPYSIGLVARPGYSVMLGRHLTGANHMPSMRVDGSTGAVTVHATSLIGFGYTTNAPAQYGYMRYEAGNGNIRLSSQSALQLRSETGVVYIGSRGTYNTMVVDGSGSELNSNLNMKGFLVHNTSDRRLKRDVKETKLNSLAAVESWSLVDYNWIDNVLNDQNGRQLGLIAQDTPELAVYDARSDTWSINNSKHTMMNTHAIQQLSDREQNTNKVASQALQATETNEQKIERLERRIEELEGVM